MKTTTTAAKEIRRELKANFPNTTFSVRSERSTINIYYTDGATVSEIESIVGKYEMGTFDGMTDSYNYNNINRDLPQVQYVFVNRTMSENVQAVICDHINEQFGTSYKHSDYFVPTGQHMDTMIYREFQKLNLYR